MVIYNMRERKPAYNLISNNCQNFALAMLDAIHIGAHKQFATSFAIYQRATGAGTIKDLFAEDHPEEEVTEPEPQHQAAVQHAHQVMDENTTKLDHHHSLW